MLKYDITLTRACILIVSHFNIRLYLLQKDSYIWLDNWPYTYTKLALNEASVNEGEDCTVLLNLEWKDAQCDLKYPAICKYNSGEYLKKKYFIFFTLIVLRFAGMNVHFNHYFINRKTSYDTYPGKMSSGQL